MIRYLVLSKRWQIWEYKSETWEDLDRNRVVSLLEIPMNFEYVYNQ